MQAACLPFIVMGYKISKIINLAREIYQKLIKKQFVRELHVQNSPFFAFSQYLCYHFPMQIAISSLLEILSSLSSEWEYADALMEKIKSWNFTDQDNESISRLITDSFDTIKDEDTRIKIQNILFQKSLMDLEEWEMKKWDMVELQEIIGRLE